MVQFSILICSASAKVLEFLLAYPSVKVSASGLIKKMGLARNTVFGALKKYAFMLTRESVGNTVLYKLNLNHPVAKQLKVLRTISMLVEEKPTDFSGEAYLFGSAARGEDTEKSDLDLLVITNKHYTFANSNIKPAFFTQFEYARLAREDKAFFESIEKNKIRVF